MKYLIRRIDRLIRSCRRLDVVKYQKVDFEINNIILELFGEKSNYYSQYVGIKSSKIDTKDQGRYFISVLQSIKNHLIFQTGCNKRYQVFISSTYLDLIDYRKAVSDEITFRGHIAAGMEDFTACGEDLQKYIKRVIDESDYYVLIIGQRFGSSIPTDENVSYTMMEYEYAKSKGMRIIPLIYNGKQDLTGNDLDINKEKFDNFVALIGKTVPQYFKDETELIKQLAKALESEIKKHPQKGWIRL